MAGVGMTISAAQLGAKEIADGATASVTGIDVAAAVWVGAFVGEVVKVGAGVGEAVNAGVNN